MRKKLLMEAPDLRVAVCHYAPGESHKVHTDRHSRVSFLLRGGYREEGSSGAIRTRPADILLKSKRAEHEDRFGDEGAYVAAIEFLERSQIRPIQGSMPQPQATRKTAFPIAQPMIPAARASKSF